MISNVATYSWSSLRLRKNIRLEAIALAGLLSAALITAPWPTLLVLSALYLFLILFGISSYAKVKRLRACTRRDRQSLSEQPGRAAARAYAVVTSPVHSNPTTSKTATT